MSEYNLQSIPRRSYAVGNMNGQVNQVEQGPSPQEKVPVTRSTHEEKQTNPERKVQADQIGLADLHLKFKVDPDTNDVTILILDKTSDKVIRTIPPEELKNLREGGLIELST